VFEPTEDPEGLTPEAEIEQRDLLVGDWEGLNKRTVNQTAS
jgi:hypothetical protein